MFNAPGKLENFTASVDFYDISITNAIATLDATFAYSKCFNADGVSNPTYSLSDPGGYCALIPASRTTLPSCSKSDASSRPNSSGDSV